MSDADEILNDELEKTTEFMTSRLSEIDTLRTENEQLKKAVKDMAEDIKFCDTTYKSATLEACLNRNSDIIKKAGGEL